MSLVGNRYIATSDPGAVGAGYQWLHSTTGDLKERNTSNAAWVYVGNVNLINYGSLPTTGGAMTGAITGVTGWATVASPNFTTSAKLAGVNLATTNDLTALQNTLTASVNAQIESLFAGLNSGLSIDNSIVFKAGVVADGATISLPFFSDRPAVLSEVKAISVAPYDVPVALSGSDNMQGFNLTVDPVTLIYTGKVVGSDGSRNSITGYYTIIAVKAQ